MKSRTCCRYVNAILCVYIAVDSNEEVVYFYDSDERAIDSVGADGTNLKHFVTNGKLSLVLTSVEVVQVM